MDMKEKLVELLNNSFAEQYEKRGLLTAPHTATDLIAHGVTVQDKTEISDEFLEQLRNTPVTILQEEPAVEVVPEWISVKDRLPDDWVLCACVDNEVHILCYDCIMDEWDIWGKPNSCYSKPFVTHWMPLPQPPKGE